MPIVKNNTRQAERLIFEKIRAGLAGMAEEGAEQYRDAIAAKTHPEFPGGPFKPPHSSRGDFPDRETGQGHESIASAVDSSGRAAAFGVKGNYGAGPYGRHKQRGGMHLIWLTGARAGRKGPVEIVRENSGYLQIGFVAAARRAR